MTPAMPPSQGADLLSMLQSMAPPSGADSALDSQTAPASPTVAEQQLAPMGEAASDDFTKKYPELKKDRERYQKLAESLGTMQAEPLKSTELAKGLTDRTPEDLQRDQTITQLAQQVADMGKPEYTQGLINKQLGERNGYIDNRIKDAYTSHGKIGTAMQFLQDMLRAKGTPSGAQAVYEMASKEYDQSVKDIHEQTAAQRNSNLQQIQLLHADRQQSRDQKVDLLSQVKSTEAGEKMKIDMLNKGLNVALSGMKVDEVAKNDDFKQAMDVFKTTYGNVPEQQGIAMAIKDFMKQGMSQSEASLKASQLFAMAKGFSKGMFATTTSMTPATVNAQGQVVPGSTTKSTTINPQAEQLMQKLQGMTGASQTQAPTVPSQVPQPAQPAPQGRTAANLVAPIVAASQTKLDNGATPMPDAVRLAALQADPTKVISARLVGNPQTMGVATALRSQAKELWDKRPWDEKELGPKPQWSEGLYKRVQDAEKNYTTGTASKQVQSLNTAIKHMDTFKQAADALSNGNIQLVNSLGATWSKETGQTPFTDFDTVKDRLSKEIASAYVAGGGGEAERSRLFQEFSSAQSPQQLVGRIQKNMTLLTGQIDTLEKKYKIDTLGTGTRPMLDSTAQAAVQKLAPQADIKVGDVRQGYKYKGGDKSDKKNWEKQ